MGRARIGRSIKDGWEEQQIDNAEMGSSKTVNSMPPYDSKDAYFLIPLILGTSILHTSKLITNSNR